MPCSQQRKNKCSMSTQTTMYWFGQTTIPLSETYTNNYNIVTHTYTKLRNNNLLVYALCISFTISISTATVNNGPLMEPYSNF